MRPISLCAVLLLGACSEERAVVVAELGQGSPARCEALSGPQPPPGEVTHLQPGGDSTFLLIDGVSREVALLNRDAERLWTRAFDRAGPFGVSELTDAAFHGDTLVLLADAGAQLLRAVRLDGRDAWRVATGFPVQRLTIAGERILVAAIGMDPRIPGLLHEVVDGGVRPLGVPFERHADGLIRMFSNSVSLLGFPDGRSVAALQFVRPVGWRIDANGGVDRFPVPVAAATARAIGWIPPLPFREADLERIAAPVIAATTLPRAGEIVFLTRTGRRIDGRMEKALVRLDRALAYADSYVLPMNAVGVAYLEAVPDSVIVVDDELRWYRCPRP